MPLSPAYRPDPRFAALGPEFADEVRPAAFPAEILRFRNQRAAVTVGLDGLTDAEWLAHFARFEPLPGNQARPLAMRYHGHQFGVYNPDLGDGRGFLFAQLREIAPPGRLLDLGTKGSGRTPWSRDGDGRLTLKGAVREVLATAMLEALGVPTSRSFSLVETGEELQRGDEPSPTRAAVLTRLSWSHIRFGTFQRHAALERPDLVGQLLGHVIGAYYPDLEGADNPAAALLAAVVRRAARLTAAWMAAGFVHGVLNTDNMNITGESFDYGPYRFLPRNDPNFVAAYFDRTGLYSFGRQPEAVFWNLRQLAGALTTVSEAEPLVEAVNGFGSAYRDELAAAMVRRLGLVGAGAAADVELANAAFRALAEGGEALRWEPFFFDWFGGEESRALAGPRFAHYGGEAFAAFRALLATRTADRPDRLADGYFAGPEPQELLIDEIEALWAAIAERDDWAPFEAKLAAIEGAWLGWAYDGGSGGLMTAEHPTALAFDTRLRIYAYIGTLIVLLQFGNPNGGFIEVPITFFLKNRLHLAAHEVALFRLIASIPLYLAFVFGFARDTFNPLGMRDRGFLVLFGAATSALYVVFAFSPITYPVLLAAVVLSTCAYLFVWSAQNGLTSTIGQQHAMSGRIATAWNVFHYLPVLGSYFLGGVLSQYLEGAKAALAARILFLIGAAVMAMVALYGLWRPASVYDNLRAERPAGSSRLADLKRLVRHWPIYPALTIWLLWSFAPGSSTPLQYFMQNTLHATDGQWGEWNAIFVAGFIPTFLLFGWLCRRYRLRTLLFWGTLVAVPQMVPLLFIHDVQQSFIAAAVIGLTGGVCSAAYLDLVIRSCPPGLQGAVMMMYWSLYYVATRFGDVLGTNLYDHFHDFKVCVIAITVVYALILPVLWLVPRRLTATADGETAA